jgi:hypothetical protein
MTTSPSNTPKRRGRPPKNAAKVAPVSEIQELKAKLHFAWDERCKYKALFEYLDAKVQVK